MRFRQWVEEGTFLDYDKTSRKRMKKSFGKISPPKLSKVEKDFIKKNTQGGRLFVPVDSKSYEYTAIQKLLKAGLVKFDYDSGSHQVFQITTHSGKILEMMSESVSRFAEIFKARNYITEVKNNWLTAAEQVIKQHQFVYINPKTNDVSDKKKAGYIMLDGVTANMLIQIADALKDVNKEKFTNMPLLQAIDVGWKLVKR